MGLFSGVKDAALALLEIAALVYPPLHKILGDAMSAHDDQSKLADQIRARLGVTSASQAAVDQLGREELDGSEPTNPNPEFSKR